MLASEKYAHKLEENVAMQREYGVKNKILTGEEIQKIYPWLKTSDIKLGTFYFNIIIIVHIAVNLQNELLCF